MEKLGLQCHRINLGERVEMPDPYSTAKAFADDFGAMEYALKRSGFLRKGKKVAEVDWNLFSQALGTEFFEQVVEQAIATTLIGVPPRRLLADMQWSPQITKPITDVAQLIIEGVCRIRNNYLHGEKFTGGPDGQWERDAILVAEAHAVLKLAMVFVRDTPSTPVR